jgi:hypothetical protein
MKNDMYKALGSKTKRDSKLQTTQPIIDGDHWELLDASLSKQFLQHAKDKDPLSKMMLILYFFYDHVKYEW